MLRLETLGGLTISSDQGERPLRRRQLALLARLAAASDRGVSRDELLAMFWPERDGDAARHSLDQLLYELRRASGTSPILGTTTLRLDPGVIACDVADWTTALANRDLVQAVALYHGPFLHGVYLQNSPGFERWVESVRAEFAAQYRRALESLATSASRDGKFSDAVDWWRRLVAEDRFGSRAALGLMHAMADAGDRAGALEFARVHEQLVRAELEAPPDPALTTYADELRRAPLAAHPKPIASSVTPAPPSAEAGARPSDSAASVAPVPTPAPQRTRIKSPVIVGAAAVLVAGMLYGVSASGRGVDMAAHWTVVRPDAQGSRGRRDAHGSGTKNLAAYDLFQQGKDLRHQRSDSGDVRAIAELEQAVTLDSNYAEAYAALGRAYGTASAFRISSRRPSGITCIRAPSLPRVAPSRSTTRSPTRTRRSDTF